MLKKNNLRGSMKPWNCKISSKRLMESNNLRLLLKHLKMMEVKIHIRMQTDHTQQINKEQVPLVLVVNNSWFKAIHSRHNRFKKWILLETWETKEKLKKWAVLEFKRIKSPELSLMNPWMMMMKDKNHQRNQL